MLTCHALKLKGTIFILLILFFICNSIYSQTGITKQDYIAALKMAEDEMWSDYQNTVAKWQQKDPLIRDLAPPKPGGHLVRIPALLFHVTKEKQYAERAREVLLNMASGDAYYIVLAVNQIKDSGFLSRKDLDIIEKKIIDS